MAAVSRRLGRRSSHQFVGSCLPEGLQAQLSPIIWQLSSGGYAGPALTNFLSAVPGACASAILGQLCSGGCAGAALTNFSGSCFVGGCAGLALFFGSCVVEAAQAQRSPISWQLFSGGCAGVHLTNFLAAVFRRLHRRSCHHFFWQLLSEAIQSQRSLTSWQQFCRRLRRLSTFFWQLCFGGCASAALTNF